MLDALRDASKPEGLNPWDYGSTTVGVLKKLGWVAARAKVVPRRYDITDAGRKALEQDGHYGG
jgi:hypothetical protein